MEISDFKKKGQALYVTLVHLDNEQHGRQEELCLSLPLRPSPHTSTRFFEALGFAAHVDARINLKEAIGHRLLVTFDAVEHGEPMPVEFQPLKENEDASAATDRPFEPAADQTPATGFDGR